MNPNQKCETCDQPVINTWAVNTVEPLCARCIEHVADGELIESEGTNGEEG